MLRPLMIGVLIFCMLSSGPAARANPAGRKDDLARTAERFLTIWLLQRDEDQALRFVSTHPILGSCMTPEILTGKNRLSRSEILDVFRKVLNSTLVRTSEARTLVELLDPSPSIPPSDRNVTFVQHSRPEYFQIFQLKPVNNPGDIAYICKFDERQSFRAEVARPNVHYLFTKIRGKASRPTLSVELLWVKEKAGWRILTMSIAEQQ